MEKFFTDKRIVKSLCKCRAKHSFARHKKHMMRNISSHKEADRCEIDPEKDIEFTFLQGILPSRRAWVKLTKKERKDFYHDSLKRNEVRIYKTYLKEKRKEESGEEVKDWFIELTKFCQDIRSKLESINDGSYRIKPPQINGLKKKVEKIGRDEQIIYRPIAIYDLEDRIITSLTSKYLISTFDSFFVDNSFAFRAADKDGKVKNHHDAVSEIFKYKKKNKRVWVSECDIAKFFDTVSHKLILEKYDKLVKEMLLKGVDTVPLARSVFCSFLESFAFNVDVLPINESDCWFEDRDIKRGKFKWVKEILIKEYGEKYVNDNRIGVPQGNAISCFIANLIMHEVDKKVLEVDANIFYVRYCDDMVLMHPDSDLCNKGLDIYKNAIKDNLLIYHEPKKIKNYKVRENAIAFWKEKSKEPFYWGNKYEGEENVPWVAFVGYQIRYDGLIRIRKDSIRKEIKKQGKEINRIHKSLGRKGRDIKSYTIDGRWSKRKILKSAEERLIAMSVGRVQMHNHKSINESGLCWTNGFKLVEDNFIARSQMRRLDKNRKRRVARLKKILPEEMKTKKPRKDDDREKKEIVHFGGAFSYYNYLKYK